jgi:5-methylcytosine-specific restriction endonuclease McrA
VIQISRGAEPAELRSIRTVKLAHLRGLGRPPQSDEIEGYRIVATHLWRAQHFKCCYCEQKIKMGFNDVEHYRPKASANRLPGCSLGHGYWWLAFTWENLLFACPACNRSAKNNRFPLNHGSISLLAEEPTPGRENPLLIDPSSTINPVEHIEFVQMTIGAAGSAVQWRARPRNGSLLGNFTIVICDLNNNELLDLRDDHFDNVIAPQVNALNYRLLQSQPKLIEEEFEKAIHLLAPRSAYVAFNYDALRFFIPNSKLQIAIRKSWPEPSQVGM